MSKSVAAHWDRPAHEKVPAPDVREDTFSFGDSDPFQYTAFKQICEERGESVMNFRRTAALACLLVSPFVETISSFGQSADQHPLLDKLAAKVIQKYQTSSCEQLMMSKANKQAPSPQEQKVLQYLKSDPQSRTIFLNKVAAPIANKMFECGMIP